jgi:hypothetical protein
VAALTSSIPKQADGRQNGIEPQATEDVPRATRDQHEVHQVTTRHGLRFSQHWKYMAVIRYIQQSIEGALNL